jgi:hypothetical protein
VPAFANLPLSTIGNCSFAAQEEERRERRY